MRELAQKAIGESEIVQNLERGWMNRVAAEVAQEISVLFQHRYRNAGSREEESKNGASRAAACDAAAGREHYTVVTSGSLGITNAQIMYSNNAIGPVARNATAQATRRTVGSMSR